MKVSEIMSGEVFTIDEREPVIAAARLLKRLNLGALPVTGRGGALTGMITDRDIAVRCVASGADARELRVGDIMTRGVYTASPDGPSLAAQEVPYSVENSEKGCFVEFELSGVELWRIVWIEMKGGNENEK